MTNAASRRWFDPDACCSSGGRSAWPQRHSRHRMDAIGSDARAICRRDGNHFAFIATDSDMPRPRISHAPGRNNADLYPQTRLAAAHGWRAYAVRQRLAITNDRLVTSLAVDVRSTE